MSVPLLLTDEIFLQHDTGRGHPERAERLRSLLLELQTNAVTHRYCWHEFRPASLDELHRVHTAAHVESVREFAHKGGGRIESDTVVSPRSFEAACRAAGAGVCAVDSVLAGEAERALCLVRPPGHHALAHQAMGFCLFNNVAVAAAHARAAHGVERVLIVDWDVHHGNGTQDIFYDTDRVVFFSAHRSPFYPGTGDADETGTGQGLGATFNLPVLFGTSRSDYLARFQTMLHDAAARCRPELVLLSAGFDAHRADPIGSLGLESEDFITLTDAVVDVARTYCQGRVVSLLEGGYNVDKLVECVLVHMDRLAT